MYSFAHPHSHLGLCRPVPNRPWLVPVCGPRVGDPQFTIFRSLINCHHPALSLMNLNFGLFNILFTLNTRCNAWMKARRINNLSNNFHLALRASKICSGRLGVPSEQVWGYEARKINPIGQAKIHLHDTKWMLHFLSECCLLFGQLWPNCAEPPRDKKQQFHLIKLDSSPTPT